MTPRHRLLAAIRGEPVDRVPLVMEGFHEPPPVAITEAGKQEIFERVADRIHYFRGYPSFENRNLVTPLQRIREVDRSVQNGNVRVTREIDTPKGTLTLVIGRNATSHTSWVVKYPVESLSDIDKIASVPWELPEGISAPDISSLPERFDEQGITYTRVSSPFVCVAGMMPYDYFLELCLTEFDRVRELSELCMTRILALLDVLLSKRTMEYVWMGGCEWLTPPMGSPRLYDELVQPFERKIIQRIHEGGALCHVHCHGNMASSLERVIERGGDFCEPVEPPPDGDITFAHAKKLAAGRITLGGNVEARILENEDARAVEAATRRAFDGGKNRMVLQTTAGPISEMTPRMVENYHRMIDVWEELSPMA